MSKRPLGEDIGDEPTADAIFDASEINEENRVPFGSMSQRLDYPTREGYHRHWFNDSPGRIARALQAGFAHVKDVDGKTVSRAVGIAEGGGVQNGFLMEIRQDWWLADLARIQRHVDAVEADIRRGTDKNGAPGDPEGRYIPPQRPIKMDVGSRRRPAP